MLPRDVPGHGPPGRQQIETAGLERSRPKGRNANRKVESPWSRLVRRQTPPLGQQHRGLRSLPGEGVTGLVGGGGGSKGRRCLFVNTPGRPQLSHLKCGNEILKVEVMWIPSLVLQMFEPGTELSALSLVTEMCLCMLSRFSCVPLFVNPMDCSSPGSSVPGISQARIPEGVTTFLLPGIFQTQVSNPYVLSPTCIGRRVLYH